MAIDILMIDDEKDFCESVTDLLAANGFQVISAHNSKEALFRASNQKYACILVDMVLGSEKGSVVIQSLRKRKESLNRNTPILVVSGHLDADKVLEIAGMVQGALVKPFDSQILLTMIDKICRPKPT